MPTQVRGAYADVHTQALFRLRQVNDAPHKAVDLDQSVELDEVWSSDHDLSSTTA